jgi:hypothetical protein
VVPNAKHNRCRETAPDAYAAKVLGFLERYAPRRPLLAPAEITARRSVLTSDFAHTLVPSALAREVATPISG